MFTHTNCEEVTQLPMDHNEVRTLMNVCTIKHMSSPNEVEQTRV